MEDLYAIPDFIALFLSLESERVFQNEVGEKIWFRKTAKLIRVISVYTMSLLS